MINTSVMILKLLDINWYSFDYYHYYHQSAINSTKFRIQNLNINLKLENETSYGGLGLLNFNHFDYTILFLPLKTRSCKNFETKLVMRKKR